MEQKLKKAQFDFDDYLESMAQMKNMGGISSILSMMPGIGGVQMQADIEDAVDEKQDGTHRGDHPFHDTEGACKSGSVKSVQKDNVSQKVQVWTSAKSTSWSKQFEQSTQDDETDSLV